MGKVKYYRLGEESDQEVISYDNKRVEINNVKDKEKQEDEYQKTVNEGLKNVLDKDTEELSNKLSIINGKINEVIVANSIPFTTQLDNDISDINSDLEKVEAIIGTTIIEKGKIRVGIFSTKKSEKKERIKKLEEAIEYLTKCQNDIIALKDEYNKLEERKEKVRDVDVESNSDTSKSLEQTISFYLKQNKES